MTRVGIPVRMRGTVKDKVHWRGFVPPWPKCFPDSLLYAAPLGGCRARGAAGATKLGLRRGRTLRVSHQDPVPPPHRSEPGPDRQKNRSNPFSGSP